MSDQVITFSKESIDTLKKTFEVNQCVRLVGNDKTLRVKSTDSTMMMIAELEEEPPRDFYIYNLKEFLSVLAIIDEPELDFSNEKFLKIQSPDGKQTLRYMESDPEFVTSYIAKDVPFTDEVFEVEVPEKEYTNVIKAASSMNLEYVGFVCDGEKITISAFNKNNGDGNVANNYSFDLGEHDTPFQMFYKLATQNINVLMNEGDLTFTVAKKKISKIKTESGKTFFIAMNPESKYGE